MTKKEIRRTNVNARTKQHPCAIKPVDLRERAVGEQGNAFEPVGFSPPPIVCIASTSQLHRDHSSSCLQPRGHEPTGVHVPRTKIFPHEPYGFQFVLAPATLSSAILDMVGAPISFDTPRTKPSTSPKILNSAVAS